MGAEIKSLLLLYADDDYDGVDDDDVCCGEDVSVADSLVRLLLLFLLMLASVVEAANLELMRLLNAQLLFGGRTQFVHTLSCRFGHAVERFARVRENLVGALCHSFSDSFHLQTNTDDNELIKTNK